MEKFLLARRVALPLALCSAVLPLGSFGCSGGHDSVIKPNAPTPRPTTQATAAPTAAPTVAPTVAPTPTNTRYTVTGNLTFANVLPGTLIPTATAITTFDTVNATNSSFGSRGIFDRTSGTSDFVTFSANQDIPANASEKRTIDISLNSGSATVPNAQFVSGQKFNLGGEGASASLGVADSSSTSEDGSFFTANSGQIEILTVGPTSISVRLTGVRFTPFFGNGDGGFDLNGTLNAINLSQGVISARTSG